MAFYRIEFRDKDSETVEALNYTTGDKFVEFFNGTQMNRRTVASYDASQVVSVREVQQPSEGEA